MTTILLLLAGWITGNLLVAAIFYGIYRWECRRGTPEFLPRIGEWPK